MDSNFDRFINIYGGELKWAVENHPTEYRYSVEEVPAVVARIAAALRKGSYNKDGIAFKRTCKFLGIPHTYKAINEFISIPFSQA